MVMRAVVRVPVLSEHRMVMEEMSCRAGRAVTTASNSRAILPAPRAMVTCSTRGRATGMAAMMMDRQVSSSSLKSSNWLRAKPCTKKMRNTSAREMRMMIFTASSTRLSNTDILAVALSAMMSALAPPISVLMPVERTIPYASPARMVLAHRIRLPCSSEGYLRGSGSPVSAAVSTDRTSPSIHSMSAGTWQPPIMRTTSPGTSRRVSSCSALPSRSTGMRCSILLVSSASDSAAFICSWKPRKPLAQSMHRMIPKSG
mmetsp:Transcript_43329/g.88670  ORF Transcript_43329/g.88670 Transcript_43329/m.88670 type:complete len:258 (+) Transcript_43329:3-776(+)